MRTKSRLQSLIERDRTGDQISDLKLDIEFKAGPVQMVYINGGKLIVAQHNAEETSSGEGLIYESVQLKSNQKKALSNRGVHVIE